MQYSYKYINDDKYIEIKLSILNAKMAKVWSFRRNTKYRVTIIGADFQFIIILLLPHLLHFLLPQLLGKKK